jgi:hypothetical protein
MKEQFERRNFQGKTLKVIERANSIIAEFQRQRFKLTVRQLFYQFVSKDWLKNTPQNYERLGSIIDDARKAGLIDWDAIEDRGRFLRARNVYEDQPDFINRLVTYEFAKYIWGDQPVYCEVWIEKDALIGVIQRVCFEYRVAYLACKGYASSSAKYDGAQRFKEKLREGKRCILFHLGDHDPSGIQMTDDNGDALATYTRGLDVEVVRLGLNLDQVREYDPPPNTAKESDSRFAGYVEQFGFEDCWELDALRPQVIEQLIRDAIEGILDHNAWNAAKEREEKARQPLRLISEHWPEVVRFIRFKDTDTGYVDGGEINVNDMLADLEAGAPEPDPDSGLDTVLPE